METQRKTAIILGATGLTGGILLRLLLEDDRYGKVKLFSRSSTGLSHQKIEEHLGDLMQLEQFEADFTGDEVFCCIGTTKSKTPNKEVYRKIDYGIPVAAAKLSAKNGISSFLVMSSMGANAKSNVFYSRLKGEMEEAVLGENIENTYLFRPSLIGGKREEKRIGELLFKQLMKVVNLVLAGPLEKYRSIKPETIAKAMIRVANGAYTTPIIESDKIKKIAGESD
ncbi:NAD(P)H-binding protein [Zobellia galactanivorans]|uniref:NAD(P)H-binding protein n=1 Tax=Zobellia galactanivorans (strain DSM 12802 / CCUG 47099 / CIP 106680 / NCIMB 13871 / Dsij) TaxID=63186 RepID=UPI0026E3CDB5|nr:NAD(P)H-binding protein [Zobellia galactanivorans]MDO6808242.1 NAD(P)H-binding protein [Zobellia galactanivorans]